MSSPAVTDSHPTIRYCRGDNGMSIAWASMGRGPDVIRCSVQNHVEQELRLSSGRAVWGELSRHVRLIRYDGRGSGLSDRNFENPTIESALADLSCVVETAGVDRFGIVVTRWSAPVAIAYCARHPDRVTRLCIIGGAFRGLLRRDHTQQDIAKFEAATAAFEAGWDDINPAYRALAVQRANARATATEYAEMCELMRRISTGRFHANWQRHLKLMDTTDDARRVRCPTLIVHAEGDPLIPFEEARHFASVIPDACLVPLDSRNNVLIESDPSFPVAMREITSFLSVAGDKVEGDTFAQLTPREHDVLNLIAQGLDNLQIAAHLGLAEKTIRNNVTAIFDKLAVENRGQAIVVAREAGLGVRRKPT